LLFDEEGAFSTPSFRLATSLGIARVGGATVAPFAAFGQVVALYAVFGVEADCALLPVGLIFARSCDEFVVTASPL
jgi:hypothetical protein